MMNIVEHFLYVYQTGRVYPFLYEEEWSANWRIAQWPNIALGAVTMYHYVVAMGTEL